MPSAGAALLAAVRVAQGTHSCQSPLSRGLAVFQGKVLKALGGWSRRRDRMGLLLPCSSWGAVLLAGCWVLTGWREVPRRGEAALMAGECGCTQAGSGGGACSCLLVASSGSWASGSHIPRGAAEVEALVLVSSALTWLLCWKRQGLPLGLSA